MGKDREGRFHPKKGKASGSIKAETGGLKSINSQEIEHNFEIADKYTIGEEEPAPNLHVRHRNRNVDKEEERQTDKFDFKNNKARKQTFKEDVTGTNTLPDEVTLPLTKEKFAELSGVKSDCCVSIYISTHRAGVEKNEQMDPIAFKTALQHTALDLKGKGFNEARLEQLLKPGYDLLRNDAFWKTMLDGLAVFITDNNFRFVRMPITPKEEVVINSSFHLGGLLPLMMNNDYFYILTLSKNRACIYRADAFDIVHIPVPELPNGVDDVVHFEEKDDQKLFRTESSGHGQGANYHGIGSGKPDDKENIKMYFDEVDETLWKAFLNKENVPLLLAGVEYLIPIYKEVAQYKPIWDNALTGNYEHADMQALYKEAREKMEPYFRQRHEAALEAYGNGIGKGLSSFFPDDVIAGAYYKRVWHLFVAKDAELWGKFDEMNNVLRIHPSQQEGDDDLIDQTIIHTILNAGEVHQLPLDQMPGKSMVAALFRY